MPSANPSAVVGLEDYSAAGDWKNAKILIKEDDGNVYEYTFDKKTFEIANVGSSPVHHQLTELEDASKYILVEVRVKFDDEAVIGNDAYFHLNSQNNNPANTRMAEEFYWVASFTMLDGYKNGKVGILSAEPYITVCGGAGATGTTTVRGSVRYYYR